MSCRSCKKIGHQAKDCPFKDKCFRCGSGEHVPRDCTNAWSAAPSANAVVPPPPAVAPARPPAAAPTVPDVGHAPAAELPSDDPPIQVPSASHPDYELPVEADSPLTSSAEMPPLESLPCSNVESMETSTHVLDSSGFVVQSFLPGLDAPNFPPSQYSVPSQNSNVEGQNGPVIDNYSNVSLGRQSCPENTTATTETGATQTM